MSSISCLLTVAEALPGNFSAIRCLTCCRNRCFCGGSTNPSTSSLAALAARLTSTLSYYPLGIADKLAKGLGLTLAGLFMEME